MQPRLPVESFTLRVYKVYSIVKFFPREGTFHDFAKTSCFKTMDPFRSRKTNL